MFRLDSGESDEFKSGSSNKRLGLLKVSASAKV